MHWHLLHNSDLLLFYIQPTLKRAMQLIHFCKQWPFLILLKLLPVLLISSKILAGCFCRKKFKQSIFCSYFFKMSEGEYQCLSTFIQQLGCPSWPLWYKTKIQYTELSPFLAKSDLHYLTLVDSRLWHSQGEARRGRLPPQSSPRAS